MSTPKETEKGRVLIADDDPAILWLIRTLVENEGFSAVTAMDETLHQYTVEDGAEHICAKGVPRNAGHRIFLT